MVRDETREVDTMQWDLGWQGAGLLVLMSVGFGVVAQLVLSRAGRWVWLVATAAYFVMGVLISEVWFGGATEVDLQPNIDGLSFDETLLGLIPGVVAVVAIRRVMTQRRRADGARPAESTRPRSGAPSAG